MAATGVGVAIVSLYLQQQAAKKQARQSAAERQHRLDLEQAQIEATTEELEILKAETLPAEIEQIKTAEQIEAERVAAEETLEEERLAEEERLLQEEFNLEVGRINEEADIAAEQAEEEIGMSRLRTQQQQEDITKQEELIAAAQVAGFAARGIAPGSKSALAVMRHSADLAEAERLKLQTNFDLFAETRRSEARRVKEGGEFSIEQFKVRKGLAAEANRFSLAQFRARNTREAGFRSTLLDFDLAAAKRKGGQVDRAIEAAKRGLIDVGTASQLVHEGEALSIQTSQLGFVTGVAGAGVSAYPKLKEQGFFSQFQTQPKPASSLAVPTSPTYLDDAGITL